MSTIAGMYFMRTAGQDIPTSECSVMDSENNLNLSEDENTSCSNSEMGCDLSLAASNNNNKPNNTSSTPLSSSSRKNKRKNFKPRNITEYAGSDEEDPEHVGMKLRQRLSAQQQANNSPLSRLKQRQQQQHHPHDDEDGDDEDDNMRDEEEEEDDDDDESEHPVITPSKRNGFAQEEDEDDAENTDDGEGVVDGRFLPENDGANPTLSFGHSENRNDRHHHHNPRHRRRHLQDASEEEEDEDGTEFRHRDGPLDLSEVQNDSRPMWKKSKQDDSSPIHSAIRNLMTNLNNNNVADPSSYLSHQVAMAAAAAAAANPAASAAAHGISGLPIMGLPNSMGIDLRLSRNQEDEEDDDPPGGDSSTTSNNENNTSSNNNNGSVVTANTTTGSNNSSHHHHYNLRHSSSNHHHNQHHRNSNEDMQQSRGLSSAETENMRTSSPSSSSHFNQHSSRNSSSPLVHHQQQQHHHSINNSSASSQQQQLLQASLAGGSSVSGSLQQPSPLNLHSLVGTANPQQMNDFAENTMKELLGLYGIAENIRQAGGKIPSSGEMLNNLHRQQLEAGGQHGKMMLPENITRLLAVMQESVVSAAAAAAAVANQNSGGNNASGNNGSSGGMVNGVGINSSNNGNSSNNNITGNENSSSGTSNNSNNNNNNASSSASSTPNPNQMIQHQSNPSSSSPTLSLNHQLNHHVQQHQSQQHLNHHQPLNFANINSLVQRSGRSPSKSPPPHHGSGLMGNHHGGLFGSRAADALLKSAKARSAGRSPTGRGLTAFPVIREGLLGKGTGPVDYTRYVRRYGNSAECGYHHCRELNYREHFHCLDCSNGTRVFVKKEEMIRHFKWHKKRDESLQHGFMRYSPMDDCSDRFLNCQHNRKQTHYHCLKETCEKVYISTSDVQMHANYHRKDSAIIQEGFQRFRAVEDCGNDNCTFRHQRTTHFHCRRPTCSYTFKNKADMEKHKSYHVKDEQLNRDGFKKFMKHETCNYTGCRFSRVCNHIHCIREGCNYVLHSSGQLYSHKRKHERRDSELAYRRFKLAQSLMRGTLAAEMSGMGISEAMLANKSEDENNSRSSFNDTPTDVDSEEIIKKFIQICQCDASSEEHFHCKVENCRNSLLGSAEIASDHSRNHELEDRISSLAFFAVDPASFDAQDSTIPCVSAKCPYQNREKHYHCLWDSCSEVILASDDPFRRLEHFRTHQYAHKMEIGDKDVPENNDGFFKRKRGRPPKNRMIEVSSGAHDTAIFTSFKLPKPVTPGSGTEGLDVSDSDVKDPIGFLSFPEGASCPDTSCPYHQQTHTCHYHCGHSRCHFSVSDVHKLSAHLRDFHSNVDILEGYAYYDRNSDCVDTKCEFRNNADHFHCTRDGLTFVQYAVMMSHEAEVHESNKSSPSSDDDADSEHWNNQVIKASGTFFPGSGAKENVNHNNPMDLSSPNGSVEPSEPKSITDHSLSRILQLAPTENSETQFGPDVPCGRAFCKLKRKHHYHCTLCNQAFSELDKLRPHVLKHSSFSPLKQSESEQYTDEEGCKNDGEGHQSPEPPKPISLPKEDLFGKHDIAGALTPPAFPPTSLPNFLNYSQSIASQSPYLFLQHNPLLYAGMMFGGAPPGVFQPGAMLTPPTLPPHQMPPSPHHLGVPTAPGLGLSVNDSNAMLVNSSLQQLQKSAATKRPPSASSSSPSSPSDSSAKKARMQMRILKDEPVPDGYIRFRFNEDCNYPHCGYREHQTHFHCTREDCGYSFCDKTRFVQHTARHERLDTLMGGDFKQFRANISCGRSNCSYVPSPGGAQGQNKASHFHCSKCDFVCTDTNKVVAHRRQHQKLDSITAAGFEKFTPSQNCNIGSCIHSQKQTHYHCLKCSYAVLGLSQMSAHKYRHNDE